MPYQKYPFTGRSSRRVRVLLWGIITGLCVCLPLSLQAEEYPSPHAPHNYNTSTNLTGMLGLNTIPSARMDAVGTVRAGLSTEDPYRHSFIGFQIAEPLYLSVRNTAEVSSFKAKADRYYPGLDMKLRLFDETATRPAIALGLDSAFGHKRMASEYLSFSKRVNNFDLTGGIAWGRLGSAGHIKNPLRRLSSHFDKARSYNSLQAQDVNDWFTGEDVGFFGGVEYFTPLKGLSVKADYSANDYIGEQAIGGFDAPEPWGVSLNYQPLDYMNFSAGILGGEKIMARLSLQDQIYEWPLRPGQKRQASTIISPRPDNDEDSGGATSLALSAHHSSGNQIGQSARLLANEIPADSETIDIVLNHKGLKGPKVTLIRRDIEEAVLSHQGSPEEIWRNTIISDPEKKSLSFKSLFEKNIKYTRAFSFVLDNKISVSDPAAGPLYRSAALIESEKEWPFGIITGASARLNLGNNLDRLKNFRFPAYEGVRSDEPSFAERRLAIDRLYSSWLKSVTNNTHLALSAGYLEEMYAGLGGEILYRPFGKTFAVGAEAWKVYKRDPFTVLNKGFINESIFTGHLNLFYEVPNTNFTTYAKIGQYLGNDFGGTIGLKNRFDNGTSIEGFLTLSDSGYQDIQGDSTHLHGGIKLNVPLGNLPLLPDGSAVRLTTGPIARTAGQVIDHPLPLYDVTEPISYRQLTRSWGEFLD